MTNINGGESLDGTFFIRLSEGQQQPQAFEPLPLATGEPLTPERNRCYSCQAIRLPPATGITNRSKTAH